MCVCMCQQCDCVLQTLSLACIVVHTFHVCVEILRTPIDRVTRISQHCALAPRKHVKHVKKTIIAVRITHIRSTNEKYARKITRKFTNQLRRSKKYAMRENPRCSSRKKLKPEQTSCRQIMNILKIVNLYSGLAQECVYYFLVIMNTVSE